MLSPFLEMRILVFLESDLWLLVSPKEEASSEDLEESDALEEGGFLNRPLPPPPQLLSAESLSQLFDSLFKLSITFTSISSEISESSLSSENARAPMEENSCCCCCCCCCCSWKLSDSES